MRVFNFNSARLQPIDRNATSFSNLSFFPGTAPHALTTRASISMLAPRKGMIMALMSSMSRASAAITPGVVSVQHIFNQGFFQPSRLGYSEMSDNLIGSNRTLNYWPMTFVQASDQILLQDTDLSTSGTIDFVHSMTYMEFDA